MLTLIDRVAAGSSSTSSYTHDGAWNRFSSAHTAPVLLERLRAIELVGGTNTKKKVTVTTSVGGVFFGSLTE